MAPPSANAVLVKVNFTGVAMVDSSLPIVRLRDPLWRLGGLAQVTPVT
jgi:hypothetical protein